MKHEQATLVFLAYVIGFTSAFIAFGLDNKSYEKSENIVIKNSEIKASAYENTSPTIEVINNEEGLFIVKDGNERVLSAVASGEDSGDGFHAEVLSATVSPNNEYVHYCASLAEDNDICVNFVYVVPEDLVYKVRYDGELLENDGEATWLADNSLSFPEGTAGSESRWHIR